MVVLQQLRGTSAAASLPPSRLHDRSRRRHSTQRVRRSVTCARKHSQGAKERDRSSHISDDSHADVTSPEAATAANAGDTISLLTVSLLWSTYSPALRYLYSLPGPPLPAALTAVRATLQAACLLPVTAVTGAPGADALANTSQASAHSHSSGGPWAVNSSERSSGGLGSQPEFWRAAAELGLLNFCGTALQAIGLEHTSATRGAFLTQTTALFTPLIDGLAGGVVSLTVWGATALGMAGTVLFTASAHGDTAALDALAPSALQISSGDTAVLGAALCYSLTTVRIGFHAARLAPLQLALAKSTGLAVLAAGWGVTEAVSAAQHHHPLASLWPGFQDVQAWGVLLAVAASGAGAAALQSRGQSRITASRAQVLFALTPVWSTVVAVAVLHEAQPSGLELLGGGLILTASLLATREKA